MCYLGCLRFLTLDSRQFTARRTQPKAGMIADHLLLTAMHFRPKYDAVTSPDRMPFANKLNEIQKLRCQAPPQPTASQTPVSRPTAASSHNCPHPFPLPIKPDRCARNRYLAHIRPVTEKTMPTPAPRPPLIPPRLSSACRISSTVFVTMPPFGKDRLLLILTSLNPTDPIQGGGGPTQKAPAYKNEVCITLTATANEYPSLKVRSSRLLFCESTREEAIMHGSLSEFEKLADLAARSPDSNYPQIDKTTQVP
ncbi:hypothetical protein B0H14DRAFT_2596507 [Mycena olivaceomarginata]|nr:hypothetical protein B0H14DRAFT_2596507 [Mycena olivaceomarginata]